MIEEKITIVIPVIARRAPINAVEACLRSLVYNSNLQNEIIIVKDRFETYAPESRELKNWLDSKSLWFNKHNIKTVDCQRTESLKHEELGAYIAGNYGAEIAENDWVILYSDCDFYYHTNWDKNLLNTVESFLRADDDATTKYSFTPVMVRLVSTVEFYIEMERGGIVPPEKQNAYDITRLNGCLYFNRARGEISESEMLSFGDRVIIPHQYTIELCGSRLITNYWPNILHKDLLNKIGGLPEDPTPNISCDLMFDTKLHKHGILKVTPLDSLFFHTYKTPTIFDVTGDRND